MENIEKIFSQLKEKKISLSDAEYSLRSYFNEQKLDPKIEKFKEVYNYLDELVGFIDGDNPDNFKEEINEFYKFLERYI